VLHVPLVFRGLSLRGGRRINSPVRSIDILPTILDYLEVSIPSQVESQSLRPWIEKSRRHALPIFAEATTYRPEREAIRANGFKYIRRLSYGALPVTIGGVLTPAEELYDLESDPGETVNRVGSQPERAAELRALMQRLKPHKNRNRSIGRQDFAVEVQRDRELQQALKALGYLN
jgi:arylsulfatase A-like enzyme